METVINLAIVAAVAAGMWFFLKTGKKNPDHRTITISALDKSMMILSLVMFALSSAAMIAAEVIVDYPLLTLAPVLCVFSFFIAGYPGLLLNRFAEPDTRRFNLLRRLAYMGFLIDALAHLVVDARHWYLTCSISGWI